MGETSFCLSKRVYFKIIAFEDSKLRFLETVTFHLLIQVAFISYHYLARNSRIDRSK